VGVAVQTRPVGASLVVSGDLATPTAVAAQNRKPQKPDKRRTTIARKLSTFSYHPCPGKT
jgi:hypothetical protein